MTCIIPFTLSLMIFTGPLLAQDVSLKIKTITLIVSDPEACRNWYATCLGFETPKTADLPGHKIITIRKDGLEIFLQKADGRMPKPANIGLSFEASSIETIYQRLKAKNVAFEAEVMSESLMVGPAAPLQKFFVIKDPQGNFVTILGKLEDGRQK